MNKMDPKYIQDFLEAAHQAAEYDLLRYSSGNLSARIDGRVLVSASRSWLRDLTAEQIAVIQLDGQKPLNDVTPSVESGFHLGIFQRRPDVNVVLHFQSPYATAIACGKPEVVNFFVIPEIPHYIGIPAIVDFYVPGSVELADAVCDAAIDHDLIILKNHGLVVLGKNYRDVIQKAGFFELACSIIVRNKQAEPLPDKELKIFLDAEAI